MPESEGPPPITETVVHHVHTHADVPPTVRREPPASFDPMARYDALYRKHPKQIGFMEVARAVPGIINQFDGRVPDERFAVTDDNQAVFDCVCGEVVYAGYNDLTDCAGCERTFVFIGGRIRVSKTVSERANAGEASELSS